MSAPTTSSNSGKVVGVQRGTYSSHLRMMDPPVLDAVKSKAIAVGERSGVPVDIIHVKDCRADALGLDEQS